jgi:hypothetical protein
MNTKNNEMVNTTLKGENTMNNNNNTVVNNEVMEGGVKMNNTVINGGLNMEVVVRRVNELAEGSKHITKVIRDEVIIPTILDENKDTITEAEIVVKNIKKAVAAYNKGVKVEEIKETKETIKDEIMESVYEEINYDLYAPMSKVVKDAFDKKHFAAEEVAKRNKNIRKFAVNSLKAQVLANKKVADLDIKEFNFLIQYLPNSQAKAKLIADFMTVSKTKSYIKQKAFEMFTKEMEVVLKNRIELEAYKTDYNTEELRVAVMVEPLQESELLRACETKEGVMADKAMTLEGKYTEEICSISMGTQLRNNKKKLINLFKIMIGCHQKDTRIFIIRMKSGLSRSVFCTRSEIKNYVREGEYAIEYQLLGVTPSGLRTGSISLAAVNTFKHGDTELTNVDRRIELLDKASNNAFSMSFVTKKNEDGTVEFAKYNSLVKLFKAMTRVMMVSTPSKKIGRVRNYIVFNNIAHKAGYNKNDYFTPYTQNENANVIDCSNTKDGTCFISVEMVLEYLQQCNLSVSNKELLGICLQARGGGNKNSSQIQKRKNLETLALALLENNASVAKLVIDGEDLDINELSKEELDDAMSKLDGVFDENCMKLVEHDNEFDLVCLKKAHEANTGLNMVINFMMLIQNEEQATELLLERAKKTIMAKFEELGIYIKLSDDGSNIESVDVDTSKFIRYNNDQQTATWLYKLSPKEILAYFPGVVKSILNNIVTSTGNLLNMLRVDVDADYTVIQADPAPIFGTRLLDDGECYSHSLVAGEIEKVSAARHPISGHKAVTTFKVVGTEELLDRIQRMNLTNNAKKFLTDYVLDMDGFILIPACHYFMEKHDGADFDIDSMQIFKDKQVVDILSQITDFGTIVDRSLDENDPDEGDISHYESLNSLSIAKFLSGFATSFGRCNKSVIKKEESAVNKKKAAFGISKKSNIGKNNMKVDAQNSQSSCVKDFDGNYSITFENTGRLILDYFLNPVAPIGFISTGFYNNALLYLALISPNVSDNVKDKIVKTISMFFGVEHTKDYISPVKTDKSYKTYRLRNGQTRTQVTLSKRMCEEVMLRYKEGNGTLQETIAFLEDTLYCNRYPGETSIDAAKNMYKVVDMFNLKDVIRACGSYKNMLTAPLDIYEEKETNDMLFEENVEILNEIIEGEYTKTNFFNLPLLKNKLAASATGEFLVTDEMTEEEFMFEYNQEKIPCIVDPLGAIRNELVDYANLAIVMVAKELEIQIKSAESNELRQKIKTQEDDINVGDKDKTSKFNIDKLLRTIMRMNININETLKELTCINIKDKDEEQEITTKKYLKTTILEVCRNYAELSLLSAETVLTPEEIGRAIVCYSIDSYEKDIESCATVNTNLITIFEKELVAFLKSEGLNIVAAERIICAIDDNKKVVYLPDLLGKHVSANKGHGITEDNEFITFDNKKATFDDGVVITDGNGKYFVETERKVSTSNYNKGVYLPITKQGVSQELRNATIVEYKYIKADQNIYTGKSDYNVIMAVTSTGAEFKVCNLAINSYVANVLDSIDFKTATINFFVSEKSTCMYLNADGLYDIAAEQASVIKENKEKINSILMDGINMPTNNISLSSTPVNNNNINNILMDGIVMPTSVEREVAIDKDQETPNSNILLDGIAMPQNTLKVEETKEESKQDELNRILMDGIVMPK